MTNRKIIEELKKEHGLSGVDVDLLCDRIEDALVIIESAQEQMKSDSGGDEMMLVKPVPYGFRRNRFNEIVPHPALSMINDAENTIRQCLKQMNVKNKGKEESKTGVLGSLMKKAG